MKIRTILSHAVTLSVITTSFLAVPVSIGVMSNSAQAEDMTDATGLTPEQQVTFIQEHRGQFGGGDQLRRFFFGDLEPVSVQPGGAGMVVNLYNKATDTTFSYCATYDVVVAVGEGRVTRFPDDQVR